MNQKEIDKMHRIIEREHDRAARQQFQNSGYVWKIDDPVLGVYFADDVYAEHSIRRRGKQITVVSQMD